MPIMFARAFGSCVVLIAVFYDTDDTIIAQPVLYEGDACFSLGGGHNYKIMSEPFYAYEVKLGPYRGQAEDKIFIE